jgi:LysM repeat protein
VHPIEPPIYHPDGGCGEPCGPVHPIEPPIYHPDGGCGEPCGSVQPIEPPIYHPDGGCGEPCGDPWYPGNSCVYVVQPGDTLAGVAAWLGVSIHDLIAVNGIVNPNLIYVGQHLAIPGCAAPLPIVDPVYPVDPSYGTYTVQPGDSLSQIAAWYGTTVWVLCDLNGIYDPNFIYVGQVLILP